MRRRRSAALLVAALAFLLYRSTLLPGVELGDSASFQTMGGSADLTPRDAYPLYFALGAPFVWLSGDPAHGMNLASAAAAAAAIGVVVLVAAELSGTVLAGVAIGLLFAGSYTFWSQSVIAEVYALHMLLVASSLLVLLRWQASPTLTRLALFFAVYAGSFGNHLSMVLLLPAFTVFLFVAAPGGWRAMIRPRIVALAAAIAVCASMQYAWNVRGLWTSAEPPPSVAEALRTFWFDVTKSDWRETMVLRVTVATMPERLRMYAFDLRQQFGWAGLVLPPLGLWALWRHDWRRALLLVLMYLTTVAFALGYNVGDAHVFFLPSHLVLAFLAAPALALLARGPLMRGAIPAAIMVLAAVRLYDNYPALDRSGDTRPAQLLASVTAGVSAHRAVLLSDLNWQVQNGMFYFERHTRRDLAHVRAPDVLLYAPALIRDNHRIGREIVLTPRARDLLSTAYGPLAPTAIDPATRPPSLAAVTAALQPGTRYVLTVLRPNRESPLPLGDLRKSLAALTGTGVAPPQRAYAFVAGVVGAPAVHWREEEAPFRTTFSLEGVTVDVRFESWLAFDTIRRMGFGHVIANRGHTQILERGVNFVAFDAAGAPLESRYFAGLYELHPRYIVLGGP